jgi:signal transduction histidine kinase/CheY-like chemotaxis protein
MRFKTLFLANFFITSFLVIFFYVFQNQTTQIQKDFDALENRTFELILKSTELEKLLIDRETGQRGYLLTGDKEFLEPFIKAGDEIPLILNQLELHFLPDDFKAITDLIEERRKYYERTFLLADNIQQQQITDLIAQGKGKFFTDSLLQLLDKQIARQQDALVQLEIDHDKQIALEELFNLFIVAFLFLSNLGLLLLAIFKITKPIESVIKYLQTFSVNRSATLDIAPPGIHETNQLIQFNREMASAILESETKLENAVAAKNLFLSNMSHELRTPLNGIYGALQLVEGHTDTEKSLLNAAKNSAEALNRIVGDILDSQRLQEGRIKLLTSWHTTLDIFNHSVELFRSVASVKKLTINANLSATLPHAIHCDDVRLGQIINNILGNAIKFTDKGEIKLSANYIEDHLIIEISDSGIGMDEVALNHLFERFTQADSSLRKQYQGAGLGMSITKQLVEIMNGTIEVTSELGKGTTFKVTLPFEGQSVTPLKPTASYRSANSSESAVILLVDDDASNRLVGSEILKKQFKNVETAADGKEALEKIINGHYDLVVTDIGMPIMNGEELLENIKSSRPDLPVIALTGNAYQTDIDSYISQGFSAVETKPFDKVSILRTVDRLLAQSE